ncbi:hypothetical protein [Nocardioides sp. GXZ039]|uniref:hypothetical protein n=1 Tax=Nocardioides sp. GXZ039 TaxID=3136018 RepID=UPI0030F40345
MGERTWQERAALGEELAAQLDRPGAEQQIMALLLDPDDTAVTYRTARALLERRDLRGVRLVLSAEARADANHAEWLGAAFSNFRADGLGAADDHLRSALRSVALDGDRELADAAADLLEWLGLDSA